MAVTGLGLVSPLGIGVEATWRTLSEGGGPAPSAGPYGGSRAEVREVAGFDPRAHFAIPKALKLTDRRTRFAVAAAREALADAGLAGPLAEPARVGVVIGSSGSDLMAEEIAGVLRGEGSPGSVQEIPWFASRMLAGLNPLWLLINLPNMVSAHVAIQVGAQGPNTTVMTDWVAGLQAVGEGCAWIESGEADLVVTGGAETASLPFVFGAYEAAGLFEAFPEREGPFVFGEGAGMLLLEEAGRAERRGARVHALIDGYGAAGSVSDDGGRDAVEVAVLEALEATGTGPGEVDAVGLASVLSRRPYGAERDGLARALAGREREIPLHAYSPRTGFALGASGAIDLVLLVKSLAAQAGAGRALCTSIGYSGQAASVAVRRQGETP